MEKKKKGLIVLIVVLFVIALGLGGWMLFSDLSQNGNYEENGNENSIRELTDENIKRQLNERLATFGFYGWFVEEDGPKMFRSENNRYYFSDRHMIIQAIYRTNNGGQDRIPFNVIDEYIKTNFNVESFNYENFEYNCSEYYGYKYDADTNTFRYCMELATGGIFTEVFPTFNINALKFEQDENYFYVHANIITAFQSGGEYFCADQGASEEELKEELEVKIFNSLEFRNPVFNNTINISCSNFEPRNEEQINNEFKTLTNYNNILTNAPVFRFVFTRDGLRLDRIEKL